MATESGTSSKPCPHCGGLVRWSEIDGPAFLRISHGEVAGHLECADCGATCLTRKGGGEDAWGSPKRPTSA